MDMMLWQIRVRERDHAFSAADCVIGHNVT
jgi:hypothetical protein